MKLLHYLQIICIWSLVMNIWCSNSSSFLKKAVSVIGNPSSDNGSISVDSAASNQEMNLSNTSLDNKEGNSRNDEQKEEDPNFQQSTEEIETQRVEQKIPDSIKSSRRTKTIGKLTTSTKIVSQNGRYQATLHKSGVLVIIDTTIKESFFRTNKLYCTNKSNPNNFFGLFPNAEFELLSDGSLKISEKIQGKDERVIWNFPAPSFAKTSTDFTLRLNNQGQLLLNGSNVRTYWTCAPKNSVVNNNKDSLYSGDFLGSSNTLVSGANDRSTLTSSNGQNKASLDNNGNLILTKNNVEVWRSSNHNEAELNEFKQKNNNIIKDYRFVLVLQEDGNVVIYYRHQDFANNTSPEIPIWATNQFSKESNRNQLIMQDDGNLVVYNDGYGPLWASDTAISIKSTIQSNIKNTISNDAGNGSIFFLDRHSLECGDFEAISRFSLVSSAINRINYQYECRSSPLIITNTCVTKYTNYNDIAADERNSSLFLDRHDMICGDNSVIRSFKLQRQNRRIRYEYRCCRTLYNGVCTSRETAKQSYGGYSILSLANRSTVSASPFTAFSRIKLNSLDKSTNFSYGYSECRVDY